MLSPRASTSPRFDPLARAQRQRPELGGRGRDTSRGERAALSRSLCRLCPLSRFPSRLQLISHVTFYLLSPGASCPRTVLLRLRSVAPPQPAAVSPAPATLGEAAGGSRVPSLSHSPHGRLGLRELCFARKAAASKNAPGRSRAPLGPARPGGRRGCPVRSSRKGGALCQPGPERAGTPWGETARRWPQDRGESPASSPCRRACATTRGTPSTWPSWPARRAPSAAS